MSVERLILTATVFLFAACASPLSPEDKAAKLAEDLYLDDPRRGEEVKKLCFASTIDGFSQATKRAVVVRDGLQDYLVTTRFRCQALDHAQSLIIDSHSACLSRGDKLISRDSVFAHNDHSIPQSCLVDKIYEWDPKADQAVEATDA